MFFFSLPKECRGCKGMLRRCKRRRGRCICFWCFQTVFAQFVKIVSFFFSLVKNHKKRAVFVSSFVFVSEVSCSFKTRCQMCKFGAQKRPCTSTNKCVVCLIIIFRFHRGSASYSHFCLRRWASLPGGCTGEGQGFKGCAWGLGEITASEGLQTVSPHINRPCNSRN